MKPSAEQMLQAAQLALRDQVATVVTDQWAASALRSVDVILEHLQARVPVEGPMLYEDNQDLAVVLAAAGEGLPGAELSRRLTAFATAAAALGQGYASVNALSDLNIWGRSLVDELLVYCHARQEDAPARDVHARLREYLHRHLDRERPFFFPTFVGRPV